MIRRFLWKLAKWLLFQLEPEKAHRLLFSILQLKIPIRIVSGAPRWEPPRVPIEVLGMNFRSRLGLAAGFDKDAEILGRLPALGFGFAEIGTVTPRPQSGNDRPRLFRDPASEAIFNRMGFNGLGATVVSTRLQKLRPELPEGFRVGVNIGKNRDTSLDRAAEDYRTAARAFEGIADYLVINVSSPNTAGLRSLQTQEALKPLVSEVLELVSGWKKRVSVLVKLAPELKGDELLTILKATEDLGVNGFVLTNTLAGTLIVRGTQVDGGWSGKPLQEASRARLREARAVTRLPIISVGGISDADEALTRLKLGADLVQIYTGWIYGGPSFPVEIQRKMAVF